MSNSPTKDSLMDIMAEFKAEQEKTSDANEENTSNAMVENKPNDANEKHERTTAMPSSTETDNPLLDMDVTTTLGYDAFLEAMVDHTYHLYPHLRSIPRDIFLQHLKQSYTVEQVAQLQKLMQQEAEGDDAMDPEKQLEAGIRIARPDLADKPEELENIKRMTAMMQMQSQMAMQQQQAGHMPPGQSYPQMPQQGQPFSQMPPFPQGPPNQPPSQH